MKKLIILVFTIVLIPLVNALTLFGEEVSILILIPSVLIFVILIVFLSMIIRDKIKGKTVGKESDNGMDINAEPPPPGGADLGELPPIDEPSETSTKTEPEEVPGGSTPLPEEPSSTPAVSQEPKKDYLKEIIALEKEFPSKGIAETHKKLNKLIKGFFSEYLGLKYYFTFEELEKELKKKNKEIQCFSDNLSSITYGPKEISEEGLIELIKEFKNIITSSTSIDQPLTPEFKKETQEHIKKIHALLKKGDKLAAKDADKAKEDYDKISQLYDELPDNDKEAIKPQIMTFFNKLQAQS